MPLPTCGGQEFPANEKLALKLLNEAASNGSGLAACYLGDFYAFGIGVPKDQAAAEGWYRKGASLHDPIAEFDLATLLFEAKDHAHDLRAAAALVPRIGGRRAMFPPCTAWGCFWFAILIWRNLPARLPIF